MNIKDIISLSNAGFNAEQIATMAAMPQEDVKTETTKVENMSPAPELIPEPPAPETIKPDASIQAMLAELSKLTTTIQAQGILNSNQPAMKQETTQDILASIIAPPKREEL